MTGTVRIMDHSCCDGHEFVCWNGDDDLCPVCRELLHVEQLTRDLVRLKKHVVALEGERSDHFRVQRDV